MLAQGPGDVALRAYSPGTLPVNVTSGFASVSEPVGRLFLIVIDFVALVAATVTLPKFTGFGVTDTCGNAVPLSVTVGRFHAFGFVELTVNTFETDSGSDGVGA